jgi:hypothetical protein
MSFTGSSYGKFTRNYLIIFGAIFLIIGIVVIFTLGNIPYAGGGMILMGGIFALVGGGIALAGVLVGRGASATDGVLATGVAGTATITGVTQTGMYLNNQPRIKLALMVQLPGQAPYAAEHSEFVPLILLYRVQPGATLPVRVDPANPQKIVVDWSGTAMTQTAATGGAGQQVASAEQIAATQQLMQRFQAGSMTAPGAPGTGVGMDESLAQVQAALAASGATGIPQAFASPEQASFGVEELRAWLRTSGTDAQARVDFVEDTGKTVGDERLYTMEMTLMVPGSAPEKLQRSAAMVPIGATSKLVQGAILPVKVASMNHHLLTVEWDKV